MYQVLERALSSKKISASEYVRLFFAKFSYSQTRHPPVVEQALTELFYLAEDYVEWPEIREPGDLTEPQFTKAIALATARLIEVSEQSVAPAVLVLSRKDRPAVARGVALVLEIARSRGLDDHEVVVLLRAFLDTFAYPNSVREALETVSKMLSVGAKAADLERSLRAAELSLSSERNWERRE